MDDLSVVLRSLEKIDDCDDVSCLDSVLSKINSGLSSKEPRAAGEALKCLHRLAIIGISERSIGNCFENADVEQLERSYSKFSEESVDMLLVILLVAYGNKIDAARVAEMLDGDAAKAVCIPLRIYRDFGRIASKMSCKIAAHAMRLLQQFVHPQTYFHAFL